MKTCILTALCTAIAVHVANAGVRQSSAYQILAESTGAGGGQSTSLNYSSDTAISGPCGTGTGHPIINLAGPVAQRPEVIGLAVSVPAASVREGTSLQLVATARYHDSTFVDVTGTGARWAAGSPLGASPSNGLVSAGAVYQNTMAAAQATYLGYTASITLLVQNTNNDDFGSYASDGVNDAWQVQYFGLNNPNAGPGADPDSDGQNNAYESVAGTSPTDAASRFQLAIANVPGQPNWRSLTFSPTMPNRAYQLQYRPALNAGYTAFGRLPATTNGTTVTVFDTNATSAARFYRVRITPQ